jgi:hypothetical protein
MPIEEIMERNKTRAYKTFEQSLSDKNKSISNDLLQKNISYSQSIADFNDLSMRASKFTTEEELKQILEEINEFLAKK